MISKHSLILKILKKGLRSNKPLRHDLKGLKRVHLEKSFVLVFEVDEEEKMVRFLDLDHHDGIYGKRH